MMHSYSKKVESLVHKLIVYTTDEESIDTEISKECDRYIRSNLKFHRFLSVNSHEIKRRIEGLQMKLFVHNKISRSDLIMKLFNTFIELPFRDNSALSDVHYSCMSFLTLCANRPTAADFEPQLEWKKEVEDDEDMKYWTRKIIEGRKDNGFLDEQSVHSSNSDLSNWSDDDEDLAVPPKRNTRELYGDSESPSLETVSNVLVHEPDDDSIEEETNFQNFIGENKKINRQEFNFSTVDYHQSYWKYAESGKSKSTSLNSRGMKSEGENTFLSSCESAIQLANPFSVSPTKPRVCLTESVIIRECIWSLLENSCNVIIFQKYSINEELSVSKDIFVSHLSYFALRNALNEVLDFKNVLKPCRLLCCELSPLIRSATISSFIEALRSEILRPFDEYMLQLEINAMDECLTFTLLDFIQKLSQWRQLLTTISSVCAQTLFQLSEMLENNQNLCSISLLLLQKCSLLLSTSLVVEVIPDCLTFCGILNVFLAAWRPYMDIIENWASLGKLIDPYGEFVAIRNPSVAVESSDFWRSACHLSEESYKFLDDKEISFLQQIIDIGKAVEMYTVSKKSLPLDFPSSIFDIFSRSLHRYFEIDESSDGKLSVEKLTWKLGQNIGDTSYGKFGAKESSYVTRYEQRKEVGSRLQFRIEKTVEEAKQHAFDAIIAQLDLANSLLLKELKSREMDYYCWGICALYLFQSNASEMHQFLFELFEDIAQRRKWQDATVLTLKLQHVFEQSNFSGNSFMAVKDFCENIVVGVKSLEQSSDAAVPLKKNRINQLSVLTVGLHIPWPINVVFSSAILESLNKIFVFLTQLKWTKYAISRLKLSDFTSIDDSFAGQDKYREPNHRVSSLFFRFRFRMLHFINVLLTYFMTRVVHAASEHLNAKISQAHTIGDVLSSIDEFVGTLKSRCLFGPECSKVRSALMNVLNTCLSFVSQCDKARSTQFDEAFVSAVSQSYKAFDSIYLFLQTLLRNLMKRGSLQHLEFLAIALT